MSRSLSLAALAVAVAFAASGCTKTTSSSTVARLRQPSSIATFQGVTLASAGAVRPYLAIANAARNDVAIVDTTTDAPVMAPIALRPVVLPIANRPALLAAASLGDDDLAANPPVHRADVLVAVAGGDNVVQLIDTWDALNTVHSDPADPLVVSLPADVLALVPMPSPAPGTARIAALLAGDSVTVLEYARDGDAIKPSGTTPGPALAFHVEAIAAMPGDPAGVLYAATRDPIATDAVSGKPVYGVVELASDLSAAKVLNALAPTRLVAAAQLRERKADSAASDTTAFDGQPTVRRVYAVLDESACGLDKPIDCGVVALDPGSAVVPGGVAIPVAIPADYSGLQRYRAPMRVVGRPLEIAVSGPPAVALGAVAGELTYPDGFMRIFMGAIPRATTAVAAVASDDGSVYFLDLGRFETEMNGSMLATRTDPVSSPPKFAYPPQEDPTAPVPEIEAGRRLWIEDLTDTPAFVADDATAATRQAAVTTKPGFTPNGSWDVRWEGTLPQLSLVTSEVVREQGTSELALAMQVTDRSGATPPSRVVKLWHPALGVQKGDIVVIQVGGMPTGCVGTVPLVAPLAQLQQTRENEFEVRVGALLPPSDAHPGGAVTLVRPDDTHPEWQACYDVLVAATAADAGTAVVPGLRSSIRAGGLLLTTTELGYLGRPQLGLKYAVQYPGYATEDTLMNACPVADWDGSPPAVGSPVLSCDDACRASCDTLVVARKARRLQNISLSCDTDAASATDCQGFWPGFTPTTTGPALQFRVDVQRDPTSLSTATSAGPFRDMALVLQTNSGVAPSAAKASGTAPYEATAAVPFDRTQWTGAGDGYHFFVSYPADFVLDTTPSVSGPYTNVIR